MASATEHETLFLVLRKTPYSDTSLVVAGISPDLGQLHFVVRGARRLSKRQFPLVDLLRLLRIRFREGKNDLHTWRTADLEADYGMVARNVHAFTAAGWLSRFALDNVMNGVAHPRFFRAVTVGLARLGEAALAPETDMSAAGIAATAGAALVFLDENGTLPEDPRACGSAVPIPSLLEMAMGECPTPMLSADEWNVVRDRCRALLLHSECRVPDWGGR